MSAFSQSVWFSRLRRLFRFLECPLTVHLGDEIRLWQSLGCLFSSHGLNVCRLSRFDQHLVHVRCWCLTHSGTPPLPTQQTQSSPYHWLLLHLLLCSFSPSWIASPGTTLPFINGDCIKTQRRWLSCFGGFSHPICHSSLGNYPHQ